MGTQLCNEFIDNYLNKKNIGLTKFKRISKTKENGIEIRKFENSNKDYFLLSEINGVIKLIETNFEQKIIKKMKDYDFSKLSLNEIDNYFNSLTNKDFNNDFINFCINQNTDIITLFLKYNELYNLNDAQIECLYNNRSVLVKEEISKIDKFKLTKNIINNVLTFLDSCIKKSEKEKYYNYSNPEYIINILKRNDFILDNQEFENLYKKLLNAKELHLRDLIYFLNKNINFNPTSDFLLKNFNNCYLAISSSNKNFDFSKLNILNFLDVDLSRYNRNNHLDFYKNILKYTTITDDVFNKIINTDFIKNDCIIALMLNDKFCPNIEQLLKLRNKIETSLKENYKTSFIIISNGQQNLPEYVEIFNKNMNRWMIKIEKDKINNLIDIDKDKLQKNYKI